MSQPIIVGYDPTSSDRAPVNFGVAAARFTGAPLIIACACAADRPGPGQQDVELVVDASDVLGRVKAALASEHVSVECRELRHTSAARALHEVGEAEDAGLLVVGSTRRGAVGRVIPGSTAERLMHGAPCPIAIVPVGWEAADSGLNTIGVAYVDTEEGREALHGAYELARRAGASLRVLSAVKGGIAEYSATEARTAEQPGRDFDEIEGELRVQAEDALRRATAALDGDVPVQADAFVEDPADALIRVSENLDLLVCGSRGYGPMRAVLLGGVSRRLTAEARCPVIVLPRGVEAALYALMETPDGAASAG